MKAWARVASEIRGLGLEEGVGLREVESVPDAQAVAHAVHLAVPGGGREGERVEIVHQDLPARGPRLHATLVGAQARRDHLVQLVGRGARPPVRRVPELLELGGQRARPDRVALGAQAPERLDPDRLGEPPPVHHRVAEGVARVEELAVLDEEHGVDEEGRHRLEALVDLFGIAGGVEGLLVAVEHRETRAASSRGRGARRPTRRAGRGPVRAAPGARRDSPRPRAARRSCRAGCSRAARRRGRSWESGRPCSGPGPPGRSARRPRARARAPAPSRCASPRARRGRPPPRAAGRGRSADAAARASARSRTAATRSRARHRSSRRWRGRAGWGSARAGRQSARRRRCASARTGDRSLPLTDQPPFYRASSIRRSILR